MHAYNRHCNCSIYTGQSYMKSQEPEWSILKLSAGNCAKNPKIE